LRVDSGALARTWWAVWNSVGDPMDLPRSRKANLLKVAQRVRTRAAVLMLRLQHALRWLLLIAAMPAVASASWLPEIFWDPGDGMLDTSRYLASARGFLPVPIVITEPAVGYGLGAAVSYFHAPKEIDREQHPHVAPPSISFGFGALTENETYGYGGGHFGVWKDDHIRYLGMIADTSINARYYGVNAGASIGSDLQFNGVKFNLEGDFIYQRIQFRLKETNWFIGGSYLFFDATSEFGLDIQPGPRVIIPPAFDGSFRSAGASVFVAYSGANTIFTPSRGTEAKLEWRDYGDTWGGDFDYRVLAGELRKYIPFGEYSHLGVRLDGEFLDGDAPFFSYPYIKLRGIPALRYEGEAVVTAELEYLWGITPRWSLVAFVGAGHARGAARDSAKEVTEFAGGAGFRYRLARLLGLQAGLDVAVGPEDTAFYLIVGKAW